jgi:phytol kinase
VTLQPIAGVLIVLTTFGAMVGLLRLFQRRCSPHPELVRKLLHIGMGLVTLIFPFIFDSPWPVALLAAIAVGAMVAAHHVEPLRRLLGSVVHGVQRQSSGEICFPIAIASVFYLSAGDPIHFAVPVLLLTLADAIAALIGVRYGSVKFATIDGGVKSVEGAIAFFVVAFLCTHLTLLLTTDVGRIESVLIGVEVGFLVMLVELISWRGLDNLFIPLFSFALLYNIETLHAGELAQRLAFLVALSIFVGIWRKRTTLDLSALIITVLFAHVFWTIGGLIWLAPPVICFATYAFLWPGHRVQHGQTHDMRAVLSFSAAGLFWLFLGIRFPEADLSYLGATTFATQLAIIGHAANDPIATSAWRPSTFARCTLLGWVVPTIPYVLLRGVNIDSLQLAAGALPVVVIALVTFGLRWPALRDDPYAPERWITQGATSFVASLFALIPWLMLLR